jgi:hypothetical protein
MIPLVFKYFLSCCSLYKEPELLFIMSDTGHQNFKWKLWSVVY